MDGALEVMEDREFEPVSSHVLRLAASSNCTAYDCEFVAIAEDLAVPLITADNQLLQHFPNVAISFALRL
jgi:predicted nucleic acid-binding protein